MAASEDQGQGPVIRDRRRIDPVTGQVREPAQGSGDGQGQEDRTQPAQRPSGGQPRPGKHAVSKPGSVRQDAAGGGQPADSPAGQAQPPAGQAQPPAGQAQPPAGQAQAPDDGADAAKQAEAELKTRLAERTADVQRIQAEYANYRKRVERDRVAVREQATASVLTDLIPVLDDIGRAREHGELTGGFKAVAEALEAATGKLGLTGFGKPGEAFDPNIHEALMHSYSPDVIEPTCVQILQPGYKVGERILRPARVAVAEPADPAGARTAQGSGDHDGDQAGQRPAEGAAKPAGEASDADADQPAD